MARIDSRPGGHEAQASSVSEHSASKIADKEWDEFVESHPAGSLYHTTVWRDIIYSAFGKTSCLLRADGADGRIVGVLPLFRIRSRLLGDRLVSTPYANYGGVLAVSEEESRKLRDAAMQRAESLRVDYVELRETELTAAGDVGWGQKSDKVVMKLALPTTTAEFGAAIGTKRRTRIRRPGKEGATVSIGGPELIHEFYEVFSRNMRDLGTPVYPRRFFEIIAKKCGERIHIVVVILDGRPVAAAFLIRWGDSLEIPWASSIREFNRIGVNMLLYWEAISLAIREGCSVFDFGRTTRNSGTFDFKQQWGAQPIACNWHYWPYQMADSGDGKIRLLGATLWRKMPLSLANRIGPIIAPNLPW